jgi:glycosyltransferase involved in cell wall biosynthesis
MIVKNESAVIRRCLASVIPFIDHWVIVDTGSTDGTQEIIKDYLKDIPGELYERPWKNFEHNRNEALDLAQGKADYFLIMDADDWLEYKSGFQLPLLTYDMYKIWRLGSGCSFLNHQIIKADLPWKWVGVVHEYLQCAHKYSYTTIENIVYRVGDDGGSYTDVNKYVNYVKLLEGALEKNPDNLRDMVSLAKSYVGANRKEKALQLYEKIVPICDSKEECFWAIMGIGDLQKDLKMPIDLSINSYYKAHRLYPSRPEPLYYLSEIYNEQGLFSLAYACLKAGECIAQKNKQGKILNEDWIEEFGLLFQLSICSFYVGEYQESLRACETLLEMKTLPSSFRKDVERNQQLVLKYLESVRPS